MPIPAQILAQLQHVRIERPDEPSPTTDLNANPYRLNGWGFAPGIVDGGSHDGILEDLDKRCKQAQILTETATFHIDGKTVEGRKLIGITRERAVKLGYKLRLWAIFQISDGAIRVVYTGHNSRER